MTMTGGIVGHLGLEEMLETVRRSGPLGRSHTIFVQDLRISGSRAGSVYGVQYAVTVRAYDGEGLLHVWQQTTGRFSTPAPQLDFAEDGALHGKMVEAEERTQALAAAIRERLINDVSAAGRDVWNVCPGVPLVPDGYTIPDGYWQAGEEEE